MSETSVQSNQEATARGDTPRVLDEISRQNQARGRSRGRGLKRFLIVVLLLVPVILTLGFLLYEQSRTDMILAQLQDENSTLRETLAQVPTAPPPTPRLELPDNLANTAMLAQLRSEMESRLNALARNEASLQQQLSALPQQQADADWVWTEAEHLLRLANQKLQLEGDGDSALLILSTVDEMLRDSGEISVLGVRDMLAGEMLALRNMGYVDLSGLYVRLNNLMPLIDQLSLRNAMVANYNAQLTQTRDELNAGEQGFVARGLALLRSIFVWQRWDVAPEALLPPPQEAVLKQNLRLMLEQAQLGLLLGEPQVYRDSLGKGADWAANYFAIDSGAGRTLTEEMRTLEQATVSVNKPDISGSLELLRQLAESRTSPESGR